MSTLPKPFVFVLMPIKPELNDIYKFGIKGAADDVGAYAERLDEQIFTEGMLDRIFNQINKADVVVADMSGRNPNVFYEVGYAHALGKIVLLLTQNADDIPFDLKHRQHTVYTHIDDLRQALIPKLEWAIAESHKQQRPGGPERISIRILGSEIPPTDQIDKDRVPAIRGEVSSRSFGVTVHLRNESLEAIVGISHVYLFSTKDAVVVPCEYRQALGDTSVTTFISSVQMNAPRFTTQPIPLDSFVASPVDAPDGLVKEFRLETHFPATPPGAVEEERIPFMFLEDVEKADSVYRLRLHSATRFFDFTFRLMLDYVEQPAKGEAASGKKKGTK